MNINVKVAFMSVDGKKKQCTTRITVREHYSGNILKQDDDKSGQKTVKLWVVKNKTMH